MKTTKLTSEMLEKLVHNLEAMWINEYLELLEKPKKLIFLNFISGLSRGLVLAFGATLVFGIVLEILRRLLLLNIPGNRRIYCRNCPNS